MFFTRSSQKRNPYLSAYGCSPWALQRFTTPHLPDCFGVPAPGLSLVVGSVASRASNATRTTVLVPGPYRLFDIRGSSAYFLCSNAFSERRRGAASPAPAQFA